MQVTCFLSTPEIRLESLTEFCIPRDKWIINWDLGVFFLFNLMCSVNVPRVPTVF